MYAVTPQAEAAWEALFRRVSADSGVELEYVRHPYPAPVADLWLRPGLGCAFMCGWPFVRGVADVEPVAAPLPIGAAGPRYWSDLVVAADGPARSLDDTEGGRVAYTLRDSQSGFSAFRAHLRDRGGPRYAEEVGPLVTPRLVIEAVADGRADIGPVDSYAHALLRRHDPALAGRVRVIARTAPTPIPLLVASRGADPAASARLRAALLALRDPALLEPLELHGFADPLPLAEYRRMEERALDAEAAGVSSLLL